MPDQLLKFNGGLFGELLTHAYGSQIEFMRKHNELVRRSRVRESQIQADAEFKFSGRELSRMTGLYEEDLEELRNHIRPFERAFAKITTNEALMIFFVYAR